MFVRIATVLSLVIVLAACEGAAGSAERRDLHESAEIGRRIVREDIQRTRTGVRKAAELMTRGFLVEEPAQREREMRMVLRRIQQPPPARRPGELGGIPELIVTATTFVATVGTNGHVIARDVDPDPMRGFDMGAVAPHLRRALRDGQPAHAIVELPSTDPEEPPSVTILFVHPSVREGRVVGAVIAGLPLWRIAQQITRQMQLENAPAYEAGTLYWGLLYKGDDLHHHAGFPDGLRAATPSPSQRQHGLRAQPRGYTGELQQYGRWYGYAVVPLPSLGEDIGLVLFQSNPPA